MTVTIRVLHVLNTLRQSGAEIMLKSAAPLWAEHGVSCEIVAIGEEPGPFAPELAEAGYPIHWIADPTGELELAVYRAAGGVVYQHGNVLRPVWAGLIRRAHQPA